MKATVQHQLRMSPELAERIEAAKGPASRNSWIIAAIEAALKPAPTLTEVENGVVYGASLAVPADPTGIRSPAGAMTACSW